MIITEFKDNFAKILIREINSYIDYIIYLLISKKTSGHNVNVQNYNVAK